MNQSIDNFMKGIYMGIDTFSYLSSKCEESSLKALLDETLAMYENHKSTLKNRLKDLNICSSDNSGVIGKMTKTVFEMKNIFTDTPEEIKLEARKALETGINMSKKFLSEYDTSDNETLLLIKGMVEDSQSILQKYN
ncbi:DUF2383 domain-containing protein [Clostridium frigidicarnis]|uniref:DUF2383 domain-containing protein n=1 Tax=Clostridium frigidicarnis TaxID=84698 RepID=A0A1I0ZVW4_9CLOT|nr:DUF2383 domain-containing protein [Clostridium frigidicarnis]SFB29701.1 protein of unknown function [Clostridium frigidicarnis]